MYKRRRLTPDDCSASAGSRDVYRIPERSTWWWIDVDRQNWECQRKEVLKRRKWKWTGSKDISYCRRQQDFWQRSGQKNFVYTRLNLYKGSLVIQLVGKALELAVPRGPRSAGYHVPHIEFLRHPHPPKRSNCNHESTDNETAIDNRNTFDNDRISSRETDLSHQPTVYQSE
jgi:hypothetical protein